MERTEDFASLIPLLVPCHSFILVCGTFVLSEYSEISPDAQPQFYSAVGKGVSQGKRPTESPPLDDPNITHEKVEFKSGSDAIDGCLARPKGNGSFTPVLVIPAELGGGALHPRNSRHARAGRLRRLCGESAPFLPKGGQLRRGRQDPLGENAGSNPQSPRYSLPTSWLYSRPPHERASGIRHALTCPRPSACPPIVVMKSPFFTWRRIRPRYHAYPATSGKRSKTIRIRMRTTR